MTQQSYLAVLANAADGQDDAFNKWYDEIHLADVLAIPGMRAARRFTLSAAQLADRGAGSHRYLALYQIDGDPQPTLIEMRRRSAAGELPLPECFDTANLQVICFTARGDWISAPS